MTFYMLLNLGKVSERKAEVLIGFILPFSLVFAFGWFGYILNNWILLFSGIVLFSTIVYGLSILRIQNLIFGQHIVQIGKKQFFYNDLISITEKNLNILLLFYWSVRKSRFYVEPAWKVYTIAYKHEGIICLNSIMLQPELKNHFDEFIKFAEKNNSLIEINLFSE